MGGGRRRTGARYAVRRSCERYEQPRANDNYTTIKNISAQEEIYMSRLIIIIFGWIFSTARRQSSQQIFTLNVKQRVCCAHDPGGQPRADMAEWGRNRLCIEQSGQQSKAIIMPYPGDIIV